LAIGKSNSNGENRQLAIRDRQLAQSTNNTNSNTKTQDNRLLAIGYRLSATPTATAKHKTAGYWLKQHQQQNTGSFVLSPALRFVVRPLDDRLLAISYWLKATAMAQRPLA
jgi:hypothetical protein